ncbi:3-hydroxybutyrate dehydrogenase [Bowmanella sp. JS7-9]|uniref:3-hydroxybutyrate dehydrogenase n=1 Tax=Pseudobowmanella zhangzhouensis TaxID=1537679 RepID=A0ABW1XI04_9ALTE|nr:3-hydroxybutyrate dehydrogenase [Bowmanella sp. JS7-9]TBX21329.1 3-hydroxybutyrate dehydrogenase [Bowmanella sp. JS7-9]
MQTVLITGGCSGIGAGIAKGLAQKGFRVIATDLNPQAVSSMTAELQALQADSRAMVMNVTSSQDVDNAVLALQDTPVDILINNAGIQHVSPLADFPMDKWDQLIQVMLVGVARVTQAFLPAMQARNFGRIINIGSIHAVIASPYKSAYIAAKHGLLGFSKTMALEFASQDITINTVCPAYVKTPLVEGQIADQAKRHGISEQEVIDKIMLEPMPKKAFITIEELLGTCEFLISPAARNITAQTMILDGGWTAR